MSLSTLFDAKGKVSSAYFRCVTSSLNLPSLIPSISPPNLAFLNIPLITCPTKTNNREDNGYPCLSPLVLPKYPQGRPSISIENFAVGTVFDRLNPLFFELEQQWAIILFRPSLAGPTFSHWPGLCPAITLPGLAQLVLL